MKLLGIDYGTKWVGVAISAGIFSSGLTRFSATVALKELELLARNEKVEKIIIGLPQSRFADKVREFGKTLEKITLLPVIFWDETLTSRQAETHLVQINSSRKRRKLDSHREAAALILESYINENKDKI